MTKRSLGIAIATGIVVRVLILIGAFLRRRGDAFLVSDSGSYLILGRSLAEGLGFRNLEGLPDLFRTPGYPLLLAIGSLLGHPVRFALAMQLVMSAGIVLLTFALAQRVLHDDRLAIACAWIVALEPTMLAWSLKVMPETLLTLALVAFAYAAVRPFETRQPRWIAAAALSLCIAAYVKPIVYPLVILICIASLLRPRIAAIFVAVCVLLLAPWHIRNARLGYAGFSTLVARAAYLSAGGSILAQREHRNYEDVRGELLVRSDVRGPTADPARYGREGLAIVASDPLAYAKTHVKGMLRTMFDPGAAEYFRFFGVYREGGRATLASGGVRGAARAYPLLFWSSVMLAIVLAPLVLMPLVAAMRTRSFAFALLFAIAAYLITAGGGVPGTSRFRVPAVPFLVVMGAFAMRAARLPET